MRISDWSSDVCSSDLTRRNIQSLPLAERCRLSQVNSLTSFCDHWCKLITLGSSSQSSFEYSSIIRMFDGRSLPKSPFQPREKSFELMKIRLSIRSEEHTSELQSLMRISYAVFCLKKKKKQLTKLK